LLEFVVLNDYQTNFLFLYFLLCCCLFSHLSVYHPSVLNFDIPKLSTQIQAPLSFGFMSDVFKPFRLQKWFEIWDFVFICLAVSVIEYTNFAELQGADFEHIFLEFFLYKLAEIERISEL
jgi:hypothetical protein